jgi:hypothetical protein
MNNIKKIYITDTPHIADLIVPALTASGLLYYVHVLNTEDVVQLLKESPWESYIQSKVLAEAISQETQLHVGANGGFLPPLGHMEGMLCVLPGIDLSKYLVWYLVVGMHVGIEGDCEDCPDVAECFKTVVEA